MVALKSGPEATAAGTLTLTLVPGEISVFMSFLYTVCPMRSVVARLIVVISTAVDPGSSNTDCNLIAPAARFPFPDTSVTAKPRMM